MTFLMNAWYVACQSSEIMDRPLGRTICGKRMVLFRGNEGRVAALDDFCPHRGAPFSLGRVVDGKLACGYHGLEVDCSGRVVQMCMQRVGGFPAVPAFPAVERYGYVWVWPGDAVQADVSKLPAFAWAESSEWTHGGGVLHVASDYRLMIDNLMDLTHETYVHTGTIGQPEIEEVPCKTEVIGDEVVTSRFMNGIQPPPFLALALRSNHLPDDQPVDRWQICHFTAPSRIMIEVGVALAGHGGYDAPLDKKVSLVVTDLITPETESTHWYFWGMARRFQVQDEALTRLIAERQGKIFLEDKVVLEQQQRNLAERPGHRLLMLNIDTGGVQSRKLLERALAAESVLAR